MSSLAVIVALIACASAQNDAVRRAEIDETTVFMTQNAIDGIEATIKQQLTASMAKLSVDSVASSVKSAIDTSFAYIEPLKNKTEKLNSDVESATITLANMRSEITSSVNTKVNEFKREVEDQLDDFKDTTEDEIQASLERVDNTLDEVTKSLGKVRTNADNLACNSDSKGVLRLKDDKMEACDGSKWSGIGGSSKYYYTQWGKSECTGKGVTKLWSGHAWGAYHDHRTGGDPICLKSGGGSNGAARDGDDSSNNLYVLRTSGPSVGGPGRVGDHHNIKCSQCVVERNCYLEQALKECPTNFEAMYSGALFGNYHGHAGQLTRLCLDRSGQWTNTGGYGAYIYPSKLKNNFDGRSSESQLQCHICCEKE